MNDDIKLETLVDLLDKAMSSEDPIIKDQLRKLLMVVALTNTGNASEKIDGPLSSVFKELSKLQSTVNALARKVAVFTDNYTDCTAVEKIKIAAEARKVKHTDDEYTDYFYANQYENKTWLKKLKNEDY